MHPNELAALIGQPPRSVAGEPITEAKASLGKSKSYVRLVLAGGRGSRLGAGPKALVEVKGQRLIDYFVSPTIQTYVMCARESLDAIQRAAPSAFCFAQDELPLIDDAGALCGSAPCGNGDALVALRRSGLLEQIDAERLIVLPIDNPLGVKAEPLLARAEGDVVVAAVAAVAGELAGGLVEVDGKVRVVEYLHAQATASWINTGIYSFARDFACRICEEPLPLHPVKKEGVWKFEKFLFDTFAYAHTVQALGLEREEIFYPIKSPGDLSRAFCYY